MPPFVHLHVHSQYSLLDGAIRLGDLIETAKGFGMPAVAVTDHGNMFGALEFYEKAKKVGIKPIIGCEIYLAPRSRHERQPATGNAGDEDRNYHLVLLAKDLTGYKNLMKLVSLAHLEGFYYKPRADKELLRRYNEGLVALSACLKGEVAFHLTRNRPESAAKAALEYQEIFGPENYYLEIQANGIPEQAIVNERLIALGKELGIPVVATNDCHYLKKGDARAHEILLCIQTGKNVLDEKRMKFSTDQLYFKSPDEMAREFAHVPEALENTVRIADMCSLEIPLGEYHFPVFPLQNGESIEDRFERTVEEGFRRRLEEIRYRRADFSDTDREEYEKRLRYEMDVIKEMGFAAYFLIVADFISYAKNKGIPVGPGRGSAAGSLVAYVMGITDLDPIEHGLIFERFLNKERISMPDIDVDFCVLGRDEVFRYVAEKYGKEQVAHITTFGTMQAKAVIRDVGRALAMPYNEVDKIAKLIPASPGMTLKKAFEQEPRLAELQRDDPQMKELFEIAFALEGLTRHASTHAAGVVIGDKPIVEYMPLYRDQEGEVVTQFSMKYVEKAGLIKFDFLGLRNLTVIHNAVDLIRKNHGVELDMQRLPLDDPKTFELLCRADTTGVFQLESSGMRDILVRLRPENFADIVALVALYRPGPIESGMVDNYIDGKHGRIPITYELEQLRPILEPTYGVILYQEQVMKIASVLANYSLGEADILRRAMGKKIPEVMAAQRERFLAGAKENGIDLAKANHIFDLMEKFAGYGFNKSHSAAYALIAYQTAYLKAHYPVEFMAALLNSFLSSTDQVVKLINECREKGIQVLPPDVNVSERDFTVVEGKIRFGLGAVKNVGEAAIEGILAVRTKDGPFRSIFDFCDRVDTSRVNRRVLEQLIKCGAFDSIHPDRARTLAALDEALEKAQARQRDRQSGQINMFDLLRAKSKAKRAEPKLPDVPSWDTRTALQFEKEALGFYISGHPLDHYRDQIAKLCTADTQKVRERKDGTKAILCGLISVTKELTTKKGERMAFLSLEDKEGTLEVVAFPEVFSRARELLQGDDPLVVLGTIQHDEKGSKVLADHILSLDDAQTQTVEAVHIHLSADRLDRDALERLRHLLVTHPGQCDAVLHIDVEGQAEAVIALNPKLQVNPTTSFLEDMTQHFGEDCVDLAMKVCRA
ncbi:DNA polymerase-3 subunit alpha [Desulfacinum infernum DSM 9756]|uniref:DNA polymerase III subunit alpha n=1 Tax=Desulfacinum infernum DSM 9756 TaxID=1121391 RepID=A0A1M5H9Y8_9BACT|nr:DNA polymerase III subunit alpha [Desulfacinum infernum]SHG12820.1 DNA polymerase-3 subunit alpha [Desulfacinum infernum DSM 9756]